MTNNVISPRDLMPADSLGEVFSSIRSRYDYCGFQVIHSEVKNAILRCLAFDQMKNQPSYIEIDTLKLNSWSPILFLRNFTQDDFLDDLPSWNFELNYYSLFSDVDFRIDDISENQRLKLHLYGNQFSSKKIQNYSRLVESIDVVSYEYPGCQIQRDVSTYSTYKGEQLTTTSIKNFIS